MSEKGPEQLPPSSTPEQGVELPDIPKSRELFRGDINDAVIEAQVQTGVEINDGFWFSEVGNDGSTESILDRFDAAYPSFVQEKMFPTAQPERLQGREKPVVFAGALAVEEAFQDNEVTQDNRYGNETLDVYSFMASENREKNTPINQEIAAELEEEARTLLAEGLSGTEVAERLGTATVVNQRAAQLLYDMGKDLPGRDTPLEQPKEEWDTDEYLSAKYAVIDGLQEELTERNETYIRLTESLLEDGLSYRDVLGSEAVRAGTNSEHPEHAAAYAHELARLTLSGRGEEVGKTAQEIRQRFDSMRSLLPESVQLSPYAESQSWIMWDIGKQEALKDKDYSSTMDGEINYSGSVLESQENNARQAEFMRDVVAWRHMGWEMHLKTANGEDMGWLDTSLDEQTRSLLHKMGDEAHKGQLSSAEYTDLGRGIESALMRQFVQERPELQAEMEKQAQELLGNMREHMMNKQQEEAAWEHYAPIGSAEYEQANQERITDSKIKVVKVGNSSKSVTMVASIKVDPETGQAVSGHESRPDAESIRDTEKAFAEYLAATPPEQRFVVYEGDQRLFDDRNKAITQAADSGLIQHLAAKEQIPTVSGEPTEAETRDIMGRLGVKQEELLALYVARGLESQIASGESDFLAGYINHHAATLGIEGFHEFSDAEKQAIVDSGRFDEVKAELNRKVEQALPALNDLYKPILDNKDLLVTVDGNVTINPEFANDIARITMDKLGWAGEHRLNEVAKLSMEMRDRVIFHRILEAYNSGKNPFVVYGGSHIVTLAPALKAYAESNA